MPFNRKKIYILKNVFCEKNISKVKEKKNGVFVQLLSWIDAH